jgi:hypothetical protein
MLRPRQQRSCEHPRDSKREKSSVDAERSDAAHLVGLEVELDPVNVVGLVDKLQRVAGVAMHVAVPLARHHQIVRSNVRNTRLIAQPCRRTLGVPRLENRMVTYTTHEECVRRCIYTYVCLID